MAKKHLQHIKSSQANKIPTAADLMYGEIAVNYANGSEQLFIKNSSDEIVPFVSGKVIEENEMAIAAGMAQLNENIEGISSSIEELSQTVEDNELVTAGALTQLNEDIENVESRVEELSQTVEDNEYVVAEAIGNINNDVKTLQVSVRNLENGVEEMNSVIVENEEVTATALNDLNYRLTNLDVNTLHMVTWQELVNLRDDYELMPGNFYRITDYVTTTSQENTQSAGHQFDIIVLALSDNQLSEDAYATFNDNDDYFLENGANLNAWKIKYCLDNDTDRFAWAQDSISEYLPDYWIQYDRDENEWVEYNKSGQVFIQFDSENMRLYATDPEEYPDEIDELDYFQYEDDTMEFNGQTYYVWRKYDKDGSSSVINQDYAILTSTLDIHIGEDAGTGVIYHMIDEHNNECPYDFKNIQFKRYKITATTKTDTSLVGKYMAASDSMAYHTVDSNDFVWCYTFNGYYASWVEEGEYIDFDNLGSVAVDMSNIDYSIFYDINDLNQGCINNIIRPLNNIYSTNIPIQTLNNIVMFGWVTDVSTLPDNYVELFGDNILTMMQTPYNNTFGYGCRNNTFGNACLDNTFRNNCHDNTFGNYSSANTFGNECYNNTFGNFGNGNTLENSCSQNAFGDGCLNNTFGYGCSTNTFANNCSSNMFGNYSVGNTFGGGCANNTFMTSCSSNTFGNNCTHNTFGHYCNNNTFGNFCYYHTFGNTCNQITFSKSYTQYVIVETGNQRITLTSTQTPTNSNPLRNITIAQGVNSTNTAKTISHNTLNDTFSTTYVNQNSVTVSV